MDSSDRNNYFGDREEKAAVWKEPVAPRADSEDRNSVAGDREEEVAVWKEQAA